MCQEETTGSIISKKEKKRTVGEENIAPATSCQD